MINRSISFVLLSLPLLVSKNILVASAPTSGPTSGPTPAPTARKCPEAETKVGNRTTATLDFDSPPAVENDANNAIIQSYCGFDFNPPPMAVDCANFECMGPATDSTVFSNNNLTITRTDGGLFALESFQFWDYNESIIELHFSFTTPTSLTEIGPFPLPLGDTREYQSQMFDMSQDIASVTLIPSFSGW
eukprot:CAMPEP_0113627790 /NCGR_PEP_ID=MMETSP0017_2-20120614/14396_1 /TAXON_ID=2856 /ORGANISM="Cylindrotheca closterium" /LENGTH=189 /DNA_ID=CAMNT_0000538065 /DNA_START=26 /DNA_END=592 /DNA_ORIENTATION=+ /assembly_acc=CAM_ASM_000147